MSRSYPIEFTFNFSNDSVNIINQYINYDINRFNGWKCNTIKDNNEAYECIFSVKMIPLLLKVFSNIKNPIDSQLIKFKLAEIMSIYNFTPEFDLSIQDFLRDEQYMFIKKICSKCSGLVQLHTGYGKNTMITYMIKHFTGSGNILIIGPTLSVIDEIKSRAEQYGVKIGDNIRSLHAAGFMNSNYKDSDEWKEWLANVSLILVDELENVSSSLESILQDYCINYKYAYGFSATANKYTNMELTWDNILRKYDTLESETLYIIYYFGQCLAYKKSTKLLNVNIVYADIPAEKSTPYKSEFAKFSDAMRNAITCESALKYSEYIVTKKSGTLMIPVKTNDQGHTYYDHLKDTTKIVFWSGSEMINNIGVDINSYDELKEHIDNNEIDVLVCTQVGYRGVDFKTISDVLLIIGTNNNIVNQIQGRSERYSGEMTTWMLYNAKDRYVNYRTEPELLLTPIFNACNGSRLKQLKSGHSTVVNVLGYLDELL